MANSKGSDNELAATSREAAEWFARVRSGDYAADGLQAWLDLGDAQRAAFAAVLDAWDLAGGLAALYPEFAPAPQAGDGAGDAGRCPAGEPRRGPGIGAE